MTRRDHYYNKAKQEGYRSRAAYKLQQIDDAEGILAPGDTVVDLGAAPGGWLQVAAERVGPDGTVIGVDFQRIDPLDDVEASVETIRGDLTADETKAEIRELVSNAEVGASVASPEQADRPVDGAATAASPERVDRPVDVVISDMAPNMTGEYSLDQARSVYLAHQAFDVARDLLASGGHLVVKVFDGSDLPDLRSEIEREFEYVKTTSPDASRQESSEVYLVAKKFITAPVKVGEEVTVTIEAVGSEGDGIAYVEGYTLFVPDTDPDETVTVRVEDVKARFGFAERLNAE